MSVLASIWVALFGFFVFAGYKAAFTTPESVANRWEDGAAFTFLVLAIVTWLIFVLNQRVGRHE